jgi:hypothetical protein
VRAVDTRLPCPSEHIGSFGHTPVMLGAAGWRKGWGAGTQNSPSPELRFRHAGELLRPMPAITTPRFSNDINEMIPSEMTQ